MPKPRPRHNSAGAAGKGDDRRPCFVPRSTFEANWDEAFGKTAPDRYCENELPEAPDHGHKNKPSPLGPFERWWNNPSNRPHVIDNSIDFKALVRRAFRAGMRTILRSWCAGAIFRRVAHPRLTTRYCPICWRPGYQRSGPHFEHEFRCGPCSFCWDPHERLAWEKISAAVQAVINAASAEQEKDRQRP